MTDDRAPSKPYGRLRQVEVYTAGMLSGESPALPVSFEDLEAAAMDALGPEAHAYVAGGAGSENTVDRNRSALDRWRIVPRMLRDVAERDLSVDLFGRTLPVPVLLAPIGVQSIVHDDAELATARAAADLDVPFVLSTVSSEPMEDVADELGDAPGWFQLYWPTDRDLAESFVRRAEDAGYEAIVLTLDTPLMGWRERDVEQAYLPFLDAEGVANYFTDPVFRDGLSVDPEEQPQVAVQRFIDVFGNPSLTWADVEHLREFTDLPIVLKGVLHPDDARKAVDHGADAVIVSNHGGRQVDGAIGAAEALPRVVRAVNGDVPVLFDSGVRRGADAVKAIALGADAVLLGRPYVYGLALAGEDGVREVLRNFLADLDVTLGLCGQSSVAGLDRSLLVDEREL
ncbi:lactate 2-monooxygenase [Halobacteriaceae archaeon GCM10025711]